MLCVLWVHTLLVSYTAGPLIPVLTQGGVTLPRLEGNFLVAQAGPDSPVFVPSANGVTVLCPNTLAF